MASGPGTGSIAGIPNANSAGSALLTAGCHALDALLLCMGCRGRGGQLVTLRKARTRSLAEIRVRDQCHHAAAFCERRRRQIGGDRRLPPAVLLPHPPRRQRRLDPRWQVPLPETRRPGQEPWSTLSMKMLDSGDVSDHPYEHQFHAFFEAIAAGQRNGAHELRRRLSHAPRHRGRGSVGSGAANRAAGGNPRLSGGTGKGGAGKQETRKGQKQELVSSRCLSRRSGLDRMNKINRMGLSRRT